MTNCPWCDELPVGDRGWSCLSLRQHGRDRKPWQSNPCHIRELEAELAGVETLLAACRIHGVALKRFGSDDMATCATANVLNEHCREYAKSKEETNEPAK